MSFQKELMTDLDELQRFSTSVGYAVSGYRTALLPFIKFCGDEFPD